MNGLMYREYPYVFEAQAQILQHGVDERGMYLILDQSLFYPQGGGQPADQGAIHATNAVYQVFDVRKIDEAVRHYIVPNGQDVCRESAVTLQVDPCRRLLNSKFHTAGHLIAAVAEQLFPQLRAVKGHQFPGEAYVEFDGVIDIEDDFLTSFGAAVQDVISRNAVVKTTTLSPEAMHALADDLPYALAEDKAHRVCHIEGFPPVPCGGTHVRTLQDIATLCIKKCKRKKNRTRIHYEVL